MPAKIKTIRQLWLEFESQVIDSNAPKVQHEEMKKAFYAGFICMLNASWEIGGDGINEEEGCKILDAYHQEVKEFVAQVLSTEPEYNMRGKEHDS